MKHKNKNTCMFIIDKSDLQVGWCNEMSTNPHTFDLEILVFFLTIYLFLSPNFQKKSLRQNIHIMFYQGYNPKEARIGNKGNEMRKEGKQIQNGILWIWPQHNHTREHTWFLGPTTRVPRGHVKTLWLATIHQVENRENNYPPAS